MLPAPLSREEEGELIARLAEGDQGASSTLIEHNLRLVVYIARLKGAGSTSLPPMYMIFPGRHSR